MNFRKLLVTAALLAIASTTAGAQASQPIELGFDGQISFGLDDQGTAIQIPVQRVRAGFPLTPAMTFEPAFALMRVSNDGNSATSFALDASVLYHFSQNRAQNQLYLRPVLGINRASFESDLADNSDTFVSLGVGFGVKIPLADRLATRLEAEFRHQLENEPFEAQSALNLNFGLSFFVR